MKMKREIKPMVSNKFPDKFSSSITALQLDSVTSIHPFLKDFMATSTRDTNQLLRVLCALVSCNRFEVEKVN